MPHIKESENLVGYRVRVERRDAFRVRGYALIAPPDAEGDAAIDAFWRDVTADGRLERLVQASSVRPWVLGLASWDPECERRGMRYTVCIEETPDADFSRLEGEYELFAKEIGASDWMCFELARDVLNGRFWQDDPYRMMKQLGYRFHAGDPSVGLHFDAFPPDYHPETNPACEFWITVTESLRPRHRTGAS